LTHWNFLKNLTGETGIKFPAKAALCCSVLVLEDRPDDGKMMPVGRPPEIGENCLATTKTRLASAVRPAALLDKVVAGSRPAGDRNLSIPCNPCFAGCMR